MSDARKYTTGLQAGGSHAGRLAALLLVALLGACATFTVPTGDCPAGTAALPDCPPPGAVEDAAVNRWYEDRTWVPAARSDVDPIDLGVRAQVPVQSARMKLLGTGDRDALYSLAAKIYMIENARHSVDAVYYIFRDDLVGRGLLGALCEAVQRGVDVRLLVDSLGTVSLDKNLLRALYHCQLQAGFIRNPAGQTTTRRARVQVVIFNAFSKVLVNMNRRSHDKLLVVDGFVPERAFVMTGGRNISLDYYGIQADGSPNQETYFDAELLLRPDTAAAEDLNVSEISELYFSLLLAFKGNTHIQTRMLWSSASQYPETEADLKQSLARLKRLPPLAESLAAMPEYLGDNYHRGEVRLAHEFANLTNRRVVSEAVANLENNPNSIMHLMAATAGEEETHIRIVSPYLFAARYDGPDGEVLLDEAAEVRQWLEANPERTYEIITNSVLTSDNFFAQSIVDMDMAPRLLLDRERMERWQSSRGEGEANPELVDSRAWRDLVSHPRLRIYETGRGDDRKLGGDQDYGKLHAKYLITDKMGFIGTSNFDYRSRLFNNEMGFFFRSEGLTGEFIADFESLRERSYRWGSPEWLAMRRSLVEAGGLKGFTTRHQTRLFKFLRATGLEWQF